MTLAIIIITAGISVLLFYNRQAYYHFTFNPYSLTQQNQWYRLLTHGVLHADWMHLLVNMFVLYSFGRNAEAYYGLVFNKQGLLFYFILYVGALVFSVIPSWYKHRNNPHYNSVGASGAVSAVIFASIIFQPMSKIYLFMMPFGIPAFIFGILYLIYSAYMAKRGRDNIGHDAHFYGAVYGLLFTILLKPSLVLIFIDQLRGG